MEKSYLLRYLNDCKDLEFTYRNLCNEQSNLNQHIKSLGIAKKIAIPTKRKAYGIGSYGQPPDSVFVNLIIIVSIIFTIVTAINYCNDIKTDTDNLNITDIIAIPFILAVFAIISMALIGIISFTLCLIIGNIVNIARYINNIFSEDKEYQMAYQIYQLEIQKDKERVSNENIQIQLIQSRIDELETQKKTISETLSKLYALGIIYPKYQTLIPTVMFCEYIEAGRCTQLEGPDGAYSIYENEIRQNIIISKLKDVIDRLEQIKDNQRMLYDAIKCGNQKVQQLCSVTYENAKHLQNNALSFVKSPIISAENSRISDLNSQILQDIKVYKSLQK